MVSINVRHHCHHHDTQLLFFNICTQCVLLILIIGAIAIHNSFPETVLPVHIYDLNCTGKENTFQNCPHNALNPNLCNYRQDASVSCLPIES